MKRQQERTVFSSAYSGYQKSIKFAQVAAVSWDLGFEYTAISYTTSSKQWRNVAQGTRNEVETDNKSNQLFHVLTSN